MAKVYTDEGTAVPKHFSLLKNNYIVLLALALHSFHKWEVYLLSIRCLRIEFMQYRNI